MTDTIPDLWPEFFAQPGAIPPVTILRQQGMKLGDKTRNLVYGDVRTQSSGDNFVHSFDLCAPELAYRQPIVIAQHDKVNPYPVTLQAVFARGQNLINATPSPDQASTPEELMKKLKTYFGAEDNIKLIGSLIAQSEAVTLEEATN